MCEVHLHKPTCTVCVGECDCAEHVCAKAKAKDSVSVSKGKECVRERVCICMNITSKRVSLMRLWAEAWRVQYSVPYRLCYFTVQEITALAESEDKKRHFSTVPKMSSMIINCTSLELVDQVRRGEYYSSVHREQFSRKGKSQARVFLMTLLLA